MQTFSLKLTVLSPVHIGTGEELTPFEYIIREKTLYRINLTALIGSLEEGARDELIGLVDRDSLAGVRKFIIENTDVGKHALYSAGVSDKCAAQYESKLGDTGHQLIINPFIRNGGTYNAFLPGSSLKGAIRTGVLNHMANSPGCRAHMRDPRDPRQIEQDIMDYKDGKEDPFRALRISDAVSAEPAATGVMELLNVKVDRLGNFTENLAVMMNEFLLPGLELECSLNIDTDLQNKSTHGAGVAYNIHINEIAEGCHNFYINNLEQEHGDFYEKEEEDICDFSNKIMEVSNEMGDNDFLIRVGRYSHFENVTIEKYRPKQKDRLAPRKGYGKTRFTARGFGITAPAGWVKCTLK
ncbi:MAG: type III-A CRISPR-associated RAMP protein Csm5 [bacterium]